MNDEGCIFCGSKAVEWPKKYFISHETRKTKLCEYHMAYPIRIAKSNDKELTDDLFDNWLCSRIKLISKKKIQNKEPLYRCVGFKEGQPDKKCVKLVYNEDSMCEACIKSNKVRAKEYIFGNKIKEIVEIMKEKNII